MRIKFNRNLPIYYNTLLAIAGISVLSFSTKAKATVGGGALSRIASSLSRGRSGVSSSLLPRAGRSSVVPAGPSMISSGPVTGTSGSQLTVRVYEPPDGGFKAAHQKLRLPSGGAVENTAVKSVSFTNLRGENVVYSEPSSTRVKLLLPDSMLVKEKYIDGSGRERTYLGVRGAGGPQEPMRQRIITVTETVTTSIVKTRVEIKQTVTRTQTTSTSSDHSTSTTTQTTSSSTSSPGVPSPSTRRSTLPRPGGLETIFEDD